MLNTMTQWLPQHSWCGHWMRERVNGIKQQHLSAMEARSLASLVDTPKGMGMIDPDGHEHNA
jgi:hypothetical protein